MKTGYQKQSLYVRKSIQVLLVLTLLLIIPYSTQGTFAKEALQQTQGNNLAFGRGAFTWQSSTHTDIHCPNGGSADQAVDDILAADGFPDGDWFNCHTTHTVGPTSTPPWWYVELDRRYFIGTVEIWNRTDCCSDRLSNFDVLVSDDGNAWQPVKHFPGTAGRKETLPINAWGKYVKIQLRGTGYVFLQLAEVRIFEGNPGGFTMSAFKDAQGNDVNPVKDGESKSFYVGQPVDGSPSRKIRFNITASSSTATSYEWKIDNDVITPSPGRTFTHELGEGPHEINLTVIDNGAAVSGRATIDIVARNGNNTSFKLSWPFVGEIGPSYWHETLNKTSPKSTHYGDDNYAEDWNWGQDTNDYGMVILSPANGRVVYSNPGSWGEQVAILVDDIPGDDNPGDFVVLIGHMSARFVGVGAEVCAGAPIGLVGQTVRSNRESVLPHAHISVWQGVFQLNSSTGADVPGLTGITAGVAPEKVAKAPTTTTPFASDFDVVYDGGVGPQGCNGKYVVQGFVGYIDRRGNQKGVSGVKIEAKDAAGNLVATQYTNEYGVYVFMNLGPGFYSFVPSKQDCTINPVQRDVQVIDRHLFRQFTADGARGCTR